MKLSELKYTDLEKLKKEFDMKALLPVGSTEQHGPHLPFGTDSIIAEEICKAAVEKRNDVILLPLIPYGRSGHHMSFPGTITANYETLVNLVKDTGNSLYAHDIKRFIIANGHGGNFDPLFRASYELKGEKPDMDISCVTILSLLPKDFKYPLFRAENLGTHAEDCETSLMLYLKPELVDMSKARKELSPLKVTRITYDLKRYSKSGVLGDPTTATVEKGKEYFDTLVSGLTKVIDSETPEWER